MGKKTDPVVPGAGDKGETPNPSTAETGASTGAESGTFDSARAMQTIRHQREEIKTLKTAMQEAQTKAEREKLSETERLRAELAEAQAKATAAEIAANERELRLKVTRSASKAGFQDPDDAWGLLDLAEAGEDIDAALGELLRKKPYLARPAVTASTSGATNGGGNGASGNASKISAGNPASGGSLTIDQIKAMTPDQIQARRAEVQAVLRGQG